MQAYRHVFVFVTLALPALFLSPTAAHAQTAVSYRFLEVMDTDGKPVVDAKVETVGWGPTSTKQTDAHGTVRDMPVYSGDYTTRSFKVSKSGYLPYEVNELFDSARYGELLVTVIPRYDRNAPIKVVLLKIPVTTAERAAVESEQRKRELLSAVKVGDVAIVRKLLRAGVSPDATDLNGIPAILWASAVGDVRTMKTLLEFGADVRNKSRPGRGALLHYLYYTRLKTVDSETVRSLVEAGADVNATNKYGATVLGLAKQSGNAEVIKLLEEAGTR